MAGKPGSRTVVFFHPDLGIGGAERLVVDAAVGLQNRGHRVVIFTSHCDPQHCFEEARDAFLGTLDVRVRGNTLVPPSILSRFFILCAILRQLHLILQVYFTSELAALQPTSFFVDQLSAGLPLLRFLYPKVGIFFYCHFPDLLLVQGRAKWWKGAYRVPFDALERWSMSFADTIAVNSKFTKGVVSNTWPSLARQQELQVVYPCIDTKPKKDDNAPAGDLVWNDSNIILSINRFERKKDVALAIRAFAGLPKEKRVGVKLVVAGGYDNRVGENVRYHKELVSLADGLGLSHATTKTIVTALNVPEQVEVLFLLSVPGTLKNMLLQSARLLVYTPANEHFGIVPLEAMLSGVPVLACNTGGPTETVVEGVTGWLRSPEEVGQWTDVMDMVLNNMTAKERAKMGKAGPERVRANFGDVQMAERIDLLLDKIEEVSAKRSSIKGVVTLCMVGVLVALGGLIMRMVGKW
ncbi:uncharacterized protein E0L32_009698 [Thyridium curvatum]|uniref:Alpha-1,3/1,6-mannosyltransferase ALG2 n=1 Tax=Thyridium curvatum TaxID=1093900 RepID=A0A507AX70_9PEZI|nr:uncharacterized protein E0L32_009698 [Thyridium curvatum]TPX08880.1 hypothetical protein E0L32_009698 [Thyridium curvatum]